MDICRLKQSAQPAGFKLRAQMLFDFCTGYPGNLQGLREVPPHARRIHPGPGKIPVMRHWHPDAEAGHDDVRTESEGHRHAGGERMGKPNISEEGGWIVRFSSFQAATDG